MGTPQFAMQDTKQPDGCYVQFEKVITPDETGATNDKDCYSPRQIAAFSRGDWHFVGVRAKAHIFIVKNGVGISTTLESPGLWGIESNSRDSYFNIVYREELVTLKSMLAAMASPTFVN